jgi:hypothetical protein
MKPCPTTSKNEKNEEGSKESGNNEDKECISNQYTHTENYIIKKGVMGR